MSGYTTVLLHPRTSILHVCFPWLARVALKAFCNPKCHFFKMPPIDCQELGSCFVCLISLGSGESSLSSLLIVTRTRNRRGLQQRATKYYFSRVQHTESNYRYESNLVPNVYNPFSLFWSLISQEIDNNLLCDVTKYPRGFCVK